jgi:hypothetical protein
VTREDVNNNNNDDNDDDDDDDKYIGKLNGGAGVEVFGKLGAEEDTWV